jgi:adenosylhomocysteine nucleosidase
VPVLVVAALPEEAAHLRGVEVLVTGGGKARAAAALARRLAAGPPVDRVVNVGTAGAVDGDVHGVVEVAAVTEHDLPRDAIAALTGSVVPIGFLLEHAAPPRPVEVLPAGVPVLATGDTFVADAAVAARIAALGAHLVDMEAFALAAVCAAFAVPFTAVKAVSDRADDAAARSWVAVVDDCARALAAWWDGHR